MSERRLQKNNALGEELARTRGYTYASSKLRIYRRMSFPDTPSDVGPPRRLFSADCAADSSAAFSVSSLQIWESDSHYGS
jgi:hypothetical protein